MSLTVATVAFFLSENIQEEMVKVAIIFLSAIAALAGLALLPWGAKLLVLLVPFIFDRYNRWSSVK
jgi:hypothetical protein